MHRFFQYSDGPFEVPPRVYARLIDSEDGEFILLDAVEARAFDRFFFELGGRDEPQRWRDLVEGAPVYAIEINGLHDSQAARDWLARNPLEELPEWSEIELALNPEGEADVYDNIAGPPQRARISLQAASDGLAQALKQATDLTPYVEDEGDIEKALPSQPIEQIFVLDVGQGAANALVTQAGDVIGYVDLGAGVLKDAGTWPSAMGGICLQHPPTVILTHWHYDHFQAANIYPAAQGMTWIAPFQTLGPGPQSAMAGAIARTGRLMVWNGSGTLSAGAIELERCTGPAGNQNRTGLAVWVEGPQGADPILLPGDAGYKDFAMRGITAFAVSHHGGRAPGTPPARPGGIATRAALSYGHNNQYKHPLNASLAGLIGSGWAIGHVHAGADERRTADRSGGMGGTGLGHIRLDWSGGSSPAHGCTCGCTLSPTQ